MQHIAKDVARLPEIRPDFSLVLTRRVTFDLTALDLCTHKGLSGAFNALCAEYHVVSKVTFMLHGNNLTVYATPTSN